MRTALEARRWLEVGSWAGHAGAGGIPYVSAARLARRPRALCSQHLRPAPELPSSLEPGMCAHLGLPCIGTRYLCAPIPSVHIASPDLGAGWLQRQAWQGAPPDVTAYRTWGRIRARQLALVAHLSDTIISPACELTKPSTTFWHSLRAAVAQQCANYRTPPHRLCHASIILFLASHTLHLQPASARHRLAACRMKSSDHDIARPDVYVDGEMRSSPRRQVIRPI